MRLGSDESLPTGTQADTPAFLAASMNRVVASSG
jgi:hypothetical protein